MVSATITRGHRADPTISPTGRAERQRRTDSIVSHLRVAQPHSGDEHGLTQQLIECNVAMAVTIASRYKNRGIDQDDLEQVALLGLTKAAQRFDANAGHDFMSFAVPTVRGEVRRHFRDSGWVIRPPRRIQDLQPRIAKAHSELEQTLDRSPRPSEVAEHLGEELDAVVEALTADGYFSPTSLDNVVGAGTSTLGDLQGGEDPAMRSVEAKMLIDPLVHRLSDRDRDIVRLRFYEERTQGEIAESIGVTQAQVSRILARILAQLRAGLDGTSDAA